MSDIRIAKNGRALASDDPALEEYFEVAPRNARRARVRLTVEKFRGQMGSESVSRDLMGDIINDPSDDELPPIIPDEILLAQESCPALDPEWDTTPNPNTPERQAPASSRVAPDP